MKLKALVAAVVLLCVGVANADFRQRALATADYGGVEMSTYTINSLVSGTGVGYSTITLPGNVGVPLQENLEGGVQGVFYGILFSTGTNVDFVDVFDSTSADAGKDRGALCRLYNVNASSGGPGSFAGGYSGLVQPARFNKGLIIRPSRADFNSLNVLFYVPK